MVLESLHLNVPRCLTVYPDAFQVVKEFDQFVSVMLQVKRQFFSKGNDLKHDQIRVIGYVVWATSAGSHLEHMPLRSVPVSETKPSLCSALTKPLVFFFTRTEYVVANHPALGRIRITVSFVTRNPSNSKTGILSSTFLFLFQV